MGSGKAEPKVGGKATPLLYARLNDTGDGFEPQRNLIQQAVGLDGGASLAASSDGNVYVTWHAPAPGMGGEANRGVWVRCSRDDGKTFDDEKLAVEDRTGACGCCGMRAFASYRGTLYILYRSAQESVHRDMFLLTSSDQGRHFIGEKLDPWQVNGCPMSSAYFTESPRGVLAAWETREQVLFTTIDPSTGKHSDLAAAPGSAPLRKHPALAANRNGEMLFAWTEGMGWNKGGILSWQMYDKDGQPIGVTGRASGVPTWSLVAVVARPDGGFTILY
jgi:hypothetical protein